MLTDPKYFLGLVIAIQAITGAAVGQEIRRIPLGDLGLSSIRSAVWMEERSAVVVSDPIGGRVMEVGLNGSGPAVPRKAPSTVRPAFIGKVSTGFLQIALDPNYGMPVEIHWLGWDFAKKGVTLLVPPKYVGGAVRSSVEDVIAALYSWIVVGGDQIFAYGVLESGTGAVTASPYKRGFFTYRLRSPNSSASIPVAKLIETFEDDDYYTLGNQYFVAIGHKVYYLEMGIYPALKVYDTLEEGVPIYVDGLPGSNMLLPRINTRTTKHDLFGTVEQLEMPAGLYADGGFLYLLRRRQDSDNVAATLWTLTKLRAEPENRAVRELGTVLLKTRAPHLTVLFTLRAVLAFEKSSIHEGTRAQDVVAVEVIPKFWVTNPGRSPLRE